MLGTFTKQVNEWSLMSFNMFGRCYKGNKWDARRGEEGHEVIKSSSGREQTPLSSHNWEETVEKK